MRVRRSLACCSRDTEISIDFDHRQSPINDKIMTYDGLESCILNSNSYDKEEINSGVEHLEEDDASSCSSSNVISPYHRQETEAWDTLDQTPDEFHIEHRPAYLFQFSDVDSIKEKFAKLLLGEDVTGGIKGIAPALALSNAITNLAASVFGELWKLEPLPEEAKNRWRKEMDWLLSPTNYMVELVPAKQSGSNGRVFEIMIPKARADVHMNLPALQKLDSMLIESLDSMVKTEFWYAEGSSHKEDKGAVRESKRWWLPYPRVPIRGLSDSSRKGLISKGNVVHQVLKAAKMINQNILSEMTVPSLVKASLPKSGRASLGEDLYNKLAEESSSASEMVAFLKLKSDHEALQTINKLEVAQLVWRERLEEHEEISGKCHARKSWPFTKNPSSEVDKIGLLMFKAEILIQELRMRYPYLPQSFLDATKIQYGKDIGHAIMEAYSRVLANLAYNILLRIGDILQEDHTSNPTSPVPMASVPGLLSPKWMVSSPVGSNNGARRSLEDRMSSRADSYFSDSNPSRRSSDLEVSSSEARSSSVLATPSTSRIWCIGSEACGYGSPYKTP